MCKVFFSSSRSIGSRLGNCDIQPCMLRTQKNENKTNKSKEEGKITILTLLRCYNLTMKTHSSAIKKIHEIN